MDQKRAVTAKQAARYRGHRRCSSRSGVLDEVQRLTDYNRHYAAWLLRNVGKVRLVKAADGSLVKLVVGQRNKRRATRRPPHYDQRVKEVLLYL